jgi:8-oxo-dGTP diphosphatase
VLSPGLWEFPGGKLEKNETPLQALQRELKEEIGITVTQASLIDVFLHQTEHKILALHAFMITAYEGTPSSCEGQMVEWRPRSDLRVLQFPPANMPLLHFLLK